MIDVSCPICGERYHADDAHEGRSLRCWKCAGIVPIERSPLVIAVPSPTTTTTSNRQARKAPTRTSSKRRLWLTVASVIALVVGGSLLWLNTRSDADTGRRQQRPPEANLPEFAPDSNVATAAPESPHVETGDAPAENAPPASRRAAVHLPNGTRLAEDDTSSGSGILILKNGNDEDAVVRVIEQSTQRTCRWVYVSAERSVTLSSVDSGEYLLVFTTGTDWDDEETRFRQHATYQKMDRGIKFKEETTEAGTHYERHTVTLNPDPRGNIGIRQISEAEFTRGRARGYVIR
jgi:hypothetical protein